MECLIDHLRDELAHVVGELLEMRLAREEARSRWAEREGDILDTEEYVRQLNVAIETLGGGASPAVVKGASEHTQAGEALGST